MSIYDVNVSQLGTAISWKENKLKVTLAFVSLMLIGLNPESEKQICFSAQNGL